MKKAKDFNKSQVVASLEQFLKYGESQNGKSHSGYFSGNGFAARCLRWHLEELKRETVKEDGIGDEGYLKVEQ